MPSPQQQPASEVHESEECKPEHGRERHGGEDSRSLILLERAGDDCPQRCLITTEGPDELSDDGANHREARGDSQAGEDARKRPWQPERPPGSDSSCSVDPEHLSKPGVDRLKAIERSGDHRKD